MSWRTKRKIQCVGTKLPRLLLHWVDKGSLGLLKELRDDIKEVEVVREGRVDIAVDRIEWEHGLQKDREKLKKRYATIDT